MLPTMRHHALPIALTVLALQILCGLLGGGVLCIEPDGHVSVERGAVACCATGESGAAAPAAGRGQTPGALQESRDGRCSECTDFALSPDSRHPSQRSATRTVAAASAQIVTLARAWPDASAGGNTPASLCADVVQRSWHRSTVLRL